MARGRGIERVECSAAGVERTTHLLSARWRIQCRCDRPASTVRCSAWTGETPVAPPDESSSVGRRNPGGGIVLVGGAGVLLRLPQAQSAVRGQAGIADLVQQGAIADAERAG